MQYQQAGDRHLLIPATGFAGGTNALSLSWHEIAQHALFSGCTYRFEREELSGHDLICRLSRKPNAAPIAGIPLYLPEMHHKKITGRSVD